MIMLILFAFAAGAVATKMFWKDKPSVVPAPVEPCNDNDFVILWQLRKNGIDAVSILTEDLTKAKEQEPFEKVQVDIGIAGYIYHIVKK